MSYASSYVDKFLSGMLTSGRALYNSVAPGFKVMGVDEEKRLIQNQWNNTIINDTAGAIQRFFDSPTYEGRLSTLISSLNNISVSVTRDYMKLGDLTGVIQDAVKLQDQYKYALEGVLTDQAVESAILVPFINDMFYAVGSNKHKDAFINEARPYLTDRFVAYFVTKVTTLVEQFERSVMALYSAHLGVTKFKFAGVKDGRNRIWCHSKVGKTFTAKQIQNWVAENWDGKIPGTSTQDIYINLGGYNCRHTLQPIKPKK